MTAPAGSLTTERLRLRPWTLDDFEAAHAFGSDPEVVRYVSFGPNTEEDTRAFLETCVADAQARPRLKYEFAIEFEGRVVGSTSIWITSAEHRRGEFGYVLAQEAWGRGLATEIAHRLVRFGREELGLHRIGATCEPANTASANVLRKAGLTYEGRMRDHYFVRGQWHDSLLFALIATD